MRKQGVKVFTIKVKQICLVVKKQKRTSEIWIVMLRG